MGIFGSLVESSKRSQLVHEQSSLASLVADKTSGKNVSQEAIRSAMLRVEITQRWLDDFSLEEQKEDRRIDRAQSELRSAQDLKHETFKSERAAKRQSDREALQEHVQELRNEAANVERSRQELAINLAEIQADESSLSLEDASEMVMQSLLGIGADDANLLGPKFLAAYHWIMLAEDSEGLFSTSEQACSLDPDSFENDFAYRIQVAIDVLGMELLTKSLEPWSTEDLERLSVDYLKKPKYKFELDGPLQLAGRTIYITKDTRVSQVKFLELDEEFWDLKKWISIPLSKDISALSHGYVCLGRSGRFFAFDQSGSYLYAGGTLFSIDDVGNTSKVGNVNLSNMNYKGTSFSYRIFDNGSNVPLQLIRTPGQLILLAAVEVNPPVDEGYKTKVSFVAIDTSTGMLLWRDPPIPYEEAMRTRVAEWYYRPATGSVCYFEDYLVKQPIENALDKRGFLQKMFGGEQPKLKPEVKHFSKIVERDLLSGKVLTEWDLAGSLMGGYSYLEVTGDDDLIHLHSRGGFKINGSFSDATFNLSNRAITFASKLNPRLSSGRLGSCRLHVLIQLLRNRGLGIGSKGEILEPTAKLVRQA